MIARISRRATRVVVAAVLAAGTTVAGAAGATAATASGVPAPQTIQVLASSHGLWLSTHHVKPSTYRFHYVTNARESDITVFTLRGNHTLAEVKRDVALAMSQDPKKGALGIRRANAAINAIGGGQVQFGHPISVTATLKAGTYYVTNFSGATRTLTVAGSRVPASMPTADKIVTMFNNNAGDSRFYPTGTAFPRSGNVWVRNDTDELHFMSITRVKPGTTDASLQHQFDLILAGKNPGPDPEIGPAAGIDVLSPGNQELLSYSLPAGTYVLICFIPDDTTGLPHAFMGMHKVITLR
ncbi:MAG: hypothetical protein ACR2JQ_07785 [Mycobacteriales bacterium]